MYQENQRYCKLCGGVIDADSKRCTKCNKQYFKVTTGLVMTIIVCVIAICLVVLNVLQYTKSKEDIAALEEQNLAITQELGEKEKQLEDYKTQLQEKSSELDNLEASIDQLESEIENLEVGIDLLEIDLEIMTSQVEFYDKHVVFVSDDGTNVYHNLRCEDFDTSYFWAFNVELAETRGYDPCPKCSYNSAK